MPYGTRIAAVGSFRFCFQLTQRVPHMFRCRSPPRVIILMRIGGIATPGHLQLSDVPVHLARYRFGAPIERSHTINESHQFVEIDGVPVHQSGPTSTDEM